MLQVANLIPDEALDNQLLEPPRNFATRLLAPSSTIHDLFRYFDLLHFACFVGLILCYEPYTYLGFIATILVLRFLYNLSLIQALTPEQISCLIAALHRWTPWQHAARPALLVIDLQLLR